jgi:hypothetical protein
MSRRKPIPYSVPALASPMYAPGEKVRILRGKFAGEIMTVRVCTSDEVFLAERPKRESMSKGNLERVE